MELEEVYKGPPRSLLSNNSRDAVPRIVNGPDWPLGGGGEGMFTEDIELRPPRRGVLRGGETHFTEEIELRPPRRPSRPDLRDSETRFISGRVGEVGVLGADLSMPRQSERDVYRERKRARERNRERDERILRFV